MTRAPAFFQRAQDMQASVHIVLTPMKSLIWFKDMVVFEESHTPWDFILSNLLYYSFYSLRPVIQHLFLALALVVDKEIRKIFILFA